MAVFNKFNIFVEDLAKKKHDLSADSFKVMLTNTAPVAANAVYADVSGTELANGNGYLTGGTATTITSCVQTAGVLKVIFTSVVFTATAAVGPFRYVVLYNATQAAPLKPLIAWFDYGSSISLANLETFTVAFDGAAGVLTIT
jgi:hypothetical protein